MASGLLWWSSILVHIFTASAATLNYDWNITWVTANPDGQLDRPVIGINGQWPPPVLNFTRGDRIIAKVHNALGNETTSVHWHGFFQNGTAHMDGPPSVTQCDIAPGSTFVYNFTVDQTGTYWYHSHTKGQYPDGLRQALVITDPKNPYAGQYDEERVITLSDWYHDPMPKLLKKFINVANPTGAEPVPDAALMNDTQDLAVAVEPGKTYLFHLANVGAFASQYFWIEGHTMKIVEVDGVWTDPSEASMIYIASAQRYAVLVTMKNETSQNYAMVGSMDTDLFDRIPDSLNYNVTGWLMYNEQAEKPAPAPIDAFEPYDDFNLVPVDSMALYKEADYTFSLDVSMDNLGDGANYAFFNGITYVMPKVPTLYSALTTGSAATDPAVYGYNTHPFVLKKGDIVDLVLNNDDAGKHPFHLHGHNFQVISRSEENAGHYDPSNHTAFPSVPMRRDTVLVRPQGHFVVRFQADNPGVWLFHCHIEWHMDSGLAATFIEAPLDLQQTLKIPENHYQVCEASNTLTEGNAAGNTKDYYDLTGENVSPAPLPAGFTAKGIVAMVFSCLAAILGLLSISWYGMAPITATQAQGLLIEVNQPDEN
ncbi:putative ferrooxidoreductase Fet3 [Aspergillus clavatus NRRL 1]|uniref:Ferrooxidoreductase Fet3, putative n=1 Tax=Aspergillus clavatus (strain ATCC 1007 / CBS 513.65 / DSM 816 / NCTC 3887 / NRRL 1 / QM 1276 / 107) TaxID=344612 RepID=A1C4V5_ASPCL|nr:ferrooxidoreductase Fet3, putative [Aspergillus clavatus NRRL 1]EAW14723.1 ferrooxidoreductase Fet3, putative [Aspergillus clavatus NRRL 1]